MSMDEAGVSQGSALDEARRERMRTPDEAALDAVVDAPHHRPVRKRGHDEALGTLS